MVKFFRIENIPLILSHNGLRSDRILISKDSCGSNYLNCSLTEVKRQEESLVQHVSNYHYHTKSELFIIGLKGVVNMLVEGRRFRITPGTVLFIEPGEAHCMVDIGKTDGAVLEVWHDPPGEETISVEYKNDFEKGDLDEKKSTRRHT